MTKSAVLAHDRIAAGGGEPSARICFLHGFFGAGRNWRSIARRLVEARPAWEGILVDLRLHGASVDTPPPHTLAAAAADVARLVRESGPGMVALLGHSFGGKVALAAASELTGAASGPGRRAAPAPGTGAELRQLWVIDSTPGLLPPGGSAHRMLSALRELPARFVSRDEAIAALEARGFDRLVARWMATNLEDASDAGPGDAGPGDAGSGDARSGEGAGSRSTDAPGGGLRWSFSLDDMEELLQSAAAAELWDIVQDPPAGLNIHFVKAETSNLLDGDALERIGAAEAETGGRVRLHHVPGGHWVNVEAPDALRDLLAAHLPQPD